MVIIKEYQNESGHQTGTNEEGIKSNQRKKKNRNNNSSYLRRSVNNKEKKKKVNPRSIRLILFNIFINLSLIEPLYTIATIELQRGMQRVKKEWKIPY